MVIGLLDAIRNNSPLEHTSSHDLESIAYVLGYAVLRSLVCLPDCPEVLKAYFNIMFGGMNIMDIINTREGGHPLAWPAKHALEEKDTLRKHISYPLASVMSKLRHTIHNQYATQEDEKLENRFRLEVSIFNLS